MGHRARDNMQSGDRETKTIRALETALRAAREECDLLRRSLLVREADRESVAQDLHDVQDLRAEISTLREARQSERRVSEELAARCRDLDVELAAARVLADEARSEASLARQQLAEACSGFQSRIAQLDEAVAGVIAAREAHGDIDAV